MHAPHIARIVQTEVCSDGADLWTVLLSCGQRDCERLAARLGARVGIIKGRPALRGTYDALLLASLLDLA